MKCCVDNNNVSRLNHTHQLLMLKETDFYNEYIGEEDLRDMRVVIKFTDLPLKARSIKETKLINWTQSIFITFAKVTFKRMKRSYRLRKDLQSHI